MWRTLQINTNFRFSNNRPIFYIHCVCPVWASLSYSNIRIYLEGVSPLCAGVTSGSISKSQGW